MAQEFIVFQKLLLFVVKELLKSDDIGLPTRVAATRRRIFREALSGRRGDMSALGRIGCASSSALVPFGNGSDPSGNP